MPGLCYYVKGERKPELNKAALKAMNFPHLKYAKCPGLYSTEGPDGPGYFFKIDEMPAGNNGKRESCHVGHNPDTRVWTKTPDGYWVGYDKNGRPNPIDFQIPPAPEGYRITLLDGNEWIMPIIRECDGMCSLPMVYGLVDGAKNKTLMPGYETLWDVACRIYDTLGIALGEAHPVTGAVPLDMEEAFAAVALAFQQNYALGEWDLRALGLCAQDELASMLQSMVDVPGTIAISAELAKADKKKVSPSASAE